MPRRSYPVQGTAVRARQYTPYPAGIAVPTPAALNTPGARMRIDDRMQPSSLPPAATTTALTADDEAGVVTLTASVTPVDAVGSVYIYMDEEPLHDAQWEGEPIVHETEALEPGTYSFLAVFIPDEPTKFQESSDEAEVEIAE